MTKTYYTYCFKDNKYLQQNKPNVNSRACGNTGNHFFVILQPLFLHNDLESGICNGNKKNR